MPLPQPLAKLTVVGRIQPHGDRDRPLFSCWLQAGGSGSILVAACPFSRGSLLNLAVYCFSSPRLTGQSEVACGRVLTWEATA